jgi:ABC-type dipeptide/oligopeptide/nickel transport system permease subunit
MAQTATAAPKVYLKPTDAQSVWSLAWRRMRRNKPAMISAVIVLLYIVFGLFANVFSPHSPVKAVSGKAQLPPFWRAESPAGQAYDPEFILGTDNAGGGRDIVSRILYGTRSSLVAGLLPAIVVLLVGTLIGFVSGYAGGMTDNILMRINDVFYAIPTELILILVTISLGETKFGRIGNGIWLFLLALASVSWSGLARQMRGSALALRNLEYVDAARSLGASDWHIIFRHVLPNSVGILVVWMAFAIPRFIIAEAALGYIGLGLRPSLNAKEFFVTSWGRLFIDAYSTVTGQPDYLLVVAVVVSVLVIAFTFLGDGLRDALDPRMKR